MVLLTEQSLNETLSPEKLLKMIQNARNEKNFIPVWGTIAGQAQCRIDTLIIIDLHDLDMALDQVGNLLYKNA